jgi:hypothetical protein
MTEQVEERTASVPLTNQVPGAWIQLADPSIPPVYVPYEPVHRKNEVTGKDEVVGHAPGAHIMRLLSEKAMYTNGPAGMAQTPAPEMASTEAALRARLEQAETERERFMKELQEIRAKMEGDQGLPNAAKKR